jgi:hypothetical protein
MLVITQMIGLKLTVCLAVIGLCACSAQGASAQSDSELVEQLRADYATLLDARREFEQFDSDPDSYTPEQADYADWIQQLSAQFAASCDELSNQAPELIPSDIPCVEFSQVYTSPANIDIGQERSHGEQVAAGEDSFEKTLGEFDEKLLREQDRVKARRPQSSDSAAAAGGGADGGAGAGAGETEGGAAEDGADEGEQASQQSDEQGSDVSGGDDRQAQGSRGASSRSSAPPGMPDGHDDDVIARQLREAAEKETNPELKTKLWEEYRRYKSGI